MKIIKSILGISLFILSVIFFSGCLEENFIPDPSNPRLPKYSESGNQVGGALINDLAWKTNFYVDFDGPGPNRSFYFTNYSKGDSIKLTLDGFYTEGSNEGRLISFDIIIKKISLNSLKDIKEKLDKQLFQLDGKNNYAVYYELCYGTCFRTTGGVGTLKIKTVKKYSCTKPDLNGNQSCNAIVAGTFDFEFPNENIKVESGRFDFSITDYYLEQE